MAAHANRNLKELKDHRITSIAGGGQGRGRRDARGEGLEEKKNGNCSKNYDFSELDIKFPRSLILAEIFLVYLF